MFYPAAILLLLVLSSLFSSCETAFSSVNKIRLKSEAMQGNKKAESYTKPFLKSVIIVSMDYI